MANKYYYLVSSLPYLDFEKPLPITKETFLNESEKWLTQEDLKRLSEANIHELTIFPKDLETLKLWKTFDNELRKEIATIRKRSLSQEEKESQPGFREIFGQANPLLMERSLERKRWDFLNGIEIDYHFDINILIIYFLKLQIIERLASFDKKKGMEIFENLCEVKYG